MKAFLFSSLLLSAGLQGQLMLDDIPAEDRKTTDAQSADIFRALRAVNFEAKEVVFPIYSGRKLITFGVSLGKGRLLVKASEVLAEQDLFTANRANEAVGAKVIGTYPEDDLAILSVPGLKAPAAKWADAASLNEGAILAAIRPDGEAQGMGVLSVRERSLKSEDQGFLGIQMDPRETGEGVRVEAVIRGSAAAEVGIQAGDVITMINDEEVRGFYELSTFLRRLKNGEQPEIQLLRLKKVIKVKPTLKGRNLDEARSGRLDRMDRMSGSQSQVRGNFGNVIQSDMELESYHAGLPVVDLEGRIVGMVIARAGRISTLILPGDDIERVLQEEATPYVPRPRVARRAQGLHDNGRQGRATRDFNLRNRMLRELQRLLNRE